MADFLHFLSQRAPELGQRVGEHLALTAISIGIAVLVGIPAGVWITRNARVRGFVLGLTSTVQTVPSLALLAFLLPLLGIGTRPAIAALTLYALLPIVRNTHTGLAEVPAQVREAARGLGFTPRQQLWMVDIPLALPVIVAGIRTAAVIGVGVATLAAAIGAGGLGVFIFQGLAMVHTPLVLLGAVPAALLALLVDGAIGAVQTWTAPARKAADSSTSNRRWISAGVVGAGSAALLAVLALPLLSPGTSGSAAKSGRVVVGSKNFTEQYVLAELMAQLIEERTELHVERQLGLGGTQVAHEALASGAIDLYAEYTGTALTAILSRPVLNDPEAVYQVTSALYEDRYQLRWLPPFGFNNTYAITVRASDAQRRGWSKASDLKPMADTLRAGFSAEFSQREDGYQGFRRHYGFSFGAVADMEPGLMYRAVAQGEVDVIAAFATDGRIAALHLQPLEDDERFFPPYYAAPVVREAVLEAHPEIREALAPLAGALDDAAMQRLNFQVDEKKREPADVAREFLETRGFISPAKAGS